jgi:hypothetical protein
MGEEKDRKRTLQQSMKVSDESVLEILIRDGVLLADYYLFCDGVCFWHPLNGPMYMIIEDDAMAIAIANYLEQIGAPKVSNKDELDALAAQRNWPPPSWHKTLDTSN